MIHEKKPREMEKLIPEVSNEILFPDATSTGEAVNLQHRLRSLSTGLVGLRNVLHEQQYLDEGATSNQVIVEQRKTRLMR